MTEQETALRRVQTMFGAKGFTCHHVDYFEVGCKVGTRTIIARGDNWEDAIEWLERKVQRANAP